MYKRLHNVSVTFRYTSYTFIVCSVQLFAATIKAGTKTKSKREEKALIVPVWPASILSWLSRPRGGDFHSSCDRSNNFHRPPQPSYPFSPFFAPSFFSFRSHARFSHRDKVISAEINYSTRGENANSSWRWARAAIYTRILCSGT